MEQTRVSSWQVGRLEIFFFGSWAEVCAEEFDSVDADVACRQLGFGAGTLDPTLVRPRQSGPAPGAALEPIAPLPICKGTEQTLLECLPRLGVPDIERPIRGLFVANPGGCFGVGNDGGLILLCADLPEDCAVRLTARFHIQVLQVRCLWFNMIPPTFFLSFPGFSVTIFHHVCGTVVNTTVL